jgi:hypothetical protein
MLHPSASHSTPSSPLGKASLDRRDRYADHPSEVAKFLDDFAWDHFVTLTTRRPLSNERIAHIFKDRFIRKLAFAAGGPIPYFYVVEGGWSTGGYPHVHALISGSKAISNNGVRRVWREGISDARRYEPARGAAYYVTQEIMSSPDDYNLSKRMPPRIRRMESTSVARTRTSK